MMKKRSFLLVALILISVSLFAAPVVVTWEWMLEDPNVTTFRYQIDGENPDEWIVVDSSVTSYTVKGLDGSKAYTLYLQQSYDGENFSGSAQAVSEPLFPAEPELVAADMEPAAVEPVVEEEMVAADAEPVVEEELVVAEEEPVVAEEMVVAEEEAVAEEEMVVAEEEPVVEEELVVAAAEPVVEAEPVVAEVAPAVVTEAPVAEKKAKTDSRYKTTITLGGGVSHLYDAFSTNVPAFNPNNVKVELGLQFKNMMTFNNTFGLGMDVGFAYTPYLANTYSWKDLPGDLFGNFSAFGNSLTHAGTVSVAPMLNMQLGKVSFDLGGGGFFTYGPDFKSTDNKEFMYGAFIKGAFAYQFNSWFSMGLDAKYNFVLVDFKNPKKFAEAGIYMGFSF